MSLHNTPDINLVKGEMAYQSNLQDNTPSTIGEQIRLDHYYKQAIIAIRNKQYFGQLAEVRAMPKHMGKTLKQFKYIPVLDDRNVNDQGIDANGDHIPASAGQAGTAGSGTAITPVWGIVKYDDATDTYEDEPSVNASTKADAETALEALVTGGQAAGGAAYLKSGGLYGSSKDLGVITAKLPALTEHGGRVNRIGFTRVVIEGTIVKRGFFSEYTQESIDFDTDDELMSHIVTESLIAANEMVEDNLQIDLLNAAGVIRFPGAATEPSDIEVTEDPNSGEIGGVITYDDLLRFSIDLDNNKAPKSTQIITGSRMIDTRTVPSARYLYIGSELIPMIEAMKDYHGNQAFKGVEQYGEAASVAVGEIGAVGHFRLIVVEEMMKLSGRGGSVAGATNAKTGAYATGGNFDVFPMLFVGSGSFATIGWQTDGRTVKFTIIHKKPGYETATAHDPYGEKGHYAIKWYYGFMALRPEWIGVLWTGAY